MSNRDEDARPRRITLEGPVARAGQLAQMLREEGVSVEWERPREQRGASEVADGVVSGLLTTGSLLAIKAAVDRFRAHVKGHAKVKIEGEPDDGGFFDT